MLNPNSCAINIAGKTTGYPNWSGFTRNSARSRLKPVAWNLGTACILYLEPLIGTLEPSGSFTWNLPRTLKPNPFVEQWNLHFELLLGTLTWNLGTSSNLHTKPPKPTWNLGTSWNFIGTLEPFGTFTWNPYTEPRATFTWNLRTSWNFYLELWNLLDPLLGTLTWNLGTSRNLVGWLPQSAPGPSVAETPKLSAVGEKPLLGTSEPLLGTWEPAATRNLGTFTWNLCLQPQNLPEPY